MIGVATADITILAHRKGSYRQAPQPLGVALDVAPSVRGPGAPPGDGRERRDGGAVGEGDVPRRLGAHGQALDTSGGGMAHAEQVGRGGAPWSGQRS